MDEYFDDVIEFEILGGYDLSENEKEKLISRAAEMGIDISDYDSWEELMADVEGWDENK